MKVSRHIDFVALLQELDIETARVDGLEHYALCPFHDDTRPTTFSVNSRHGTYYCFSCGEHGGLLTLIAHQRQLYLSTRGMEGQRYYDYASAETWLREKGQTLEGLHELPEWERKEERSERPEMGEALLAIYSDPPVQPLLRRRLDLDACRQHGVLWYPKNRSWILPVRDPYVHALWGWQEKQEYERGFNNYPPRIKKSRTLFGLDCYVGERMVLVESPLDAVRLTSCGVTGAVSSYGAVVSDYQIDLIVEHADSLVVAFDNPATDDAGRKASFDMLSALSKRIDLRFLDYSSGVKDIGDMTRDSDVRSAVANAKHAWRGKRAFA